MKKRTKIILAVLIVALLGINLYLYLLKPYLDKCPTKIFWAPDPKTGELGAEYWKYKAQCPFTTIIIH